MTGWAWTFWSTMTCRFRDRFPSSSGCFPTTRPAPPIWRRRAGRWVRLSRTVRSGWRAVPFRNRPGVLRCRKCRSDTGLTVGTVMERTHTPLSVWFWAAYLVASQTPGMSAVQFQRQLGLSRYETAFQILHKLRAGMVRPDQDRIGGKPGEHVEVDEGYDRWTRRAAKAGASTDKMLVASAVEVRQRKPGTKLDKREGRPLRRPCSARHRARSERRSLCGFVESAVMPGTLIVTDDWSGYASLGKRGYDHLAVAEWGDPRWPRSICRSSISSLPT